MNEHFRLIRHSDFAWHDRFFDFVASIFEGGRTFSDWGERAAGSMDMKFLQWSSTTK